MENGKVFDFREYVFLFFRNWKSVIIISVLTSLLMGFLYIMPPMNTWFDTNARLVMQQEQEQKIQSYQNQIGALEQNIAVLEGSLNAATNYKKDSILMQIDPYKTYTGTLYLYVNTHYKINTDIVLQEVDKTDAVTNAYMSILSESDIFEKLSGKTQIDSKFVKELININKIGDYGVSVKVFGKSKNDVTDLITAINEYALDQKDNISRSVVDHDLHIVNKSTYTAINSWIQELQNQQISSIDTINRSLEEVKAQKEALKPVEKKTKTGALKYAVIGFAVGLILSILFIFAKDLMDDRIYTKRVIDREYGIREIGDWRSSKLSNISFLDKYILYLCGELISTKEIANRADIFWINMLSIQKIEEKKNILILDSHNTKEIIEDQLDSSSKKMSNVKIRFAQDVLNDVDDMELLLNCNGILLIVKHAKTTEEEIKQKIELSDNFGKPIIGYLFT